jgi:hypothetical protein
MCDQKLLNNELKKYINMCAKKTITGIIKLFENLKIILKKTKTKTDIIIINKILFALYFFFKFIEMTGLNNKFVFKILDKHIINNKVYTFFKNILSKKQKNRRGGTRKIGGGKQSSSKQSSSKKSSSKQSGSKKSKKSSIKTKKNGGRKPKQTGGMFANFILILIILITITSVFSISGINNLFNDKNIDIHKEIYDLCNYPLLNNELGSCSMGARAMIGHNINQTIDNVYTDSLKNGMYIVAKDSQNVFRHGTSYEQINIEYKNFDYKNKEDTTLQKYYEDYVSKFVDDDIKYVLIYSGIVFKPSLDHSIVTIVKKQINGDGSISYLFGAMDPNYLCTAIQFLVTGVDNGIEKFIYVQEGFFHKDDPASKFSTIANDPYEEMAENNFGAPIIGVDIAIETEYLTPSLYLPFFNEQNLRDIKAATEKVMLFQTTIPDFVGDPNMKNLVMNIENIIQNFEMRIYTPKYTIFDFDEFDEYIKEQIKDTDDETFYFPLTFMQDNYSKIIDDNGKLKFNVDESGLIHVENTKILEETAVCIVQKKEENKYEYAFLINSDLYKTTNFDKDDVYTETDIQIYNSSNPFNQLPFLRNNKYSELFASNYLRPSYMTIPEKYRIDAASFVAEVNTKLLYHNNTYGQQKLFAEIFSE